MRAGQLKGRAKSSAKGFSPLLTGFDKALLKGRCPSEGSDACARRLSRQSEALRYQTGKTGQERSSDGLPSFSKDLGSAKLFLCGLS